MADLDDSAEKAIELFAKCCEQLNAFARDIGLQWQYGGVRSHADIRYYTTGWRLEKSVEADVCVAEGHVAAWCLELSRASNNWVVSSNVNISHSDIYIDLGCCQASSVEQLGDALGEALNLLKSTAKSGSEFSNSIERLACIPPGS